MKFTLSWLKDHLETDASVEAIADALTRIGLEVEGVEDKAEALAAFSVAEVISAEPDGIRELKSETKAKFEMAVAAYLERNFEGALASFREVLRLAPDSELGHSVAEYINILK